MTIDRKCTRCGGSRLEAGKIESYSGPVFFKPDNVRFFTFETSRVEVRASICLDCGTVEFVGDIDKARSLTGTAKQV